MEIKTIYKYEDIKFIINNFLAIRQLVDELNNKTGRRFTIDGHLFGSIGEALASYLFGIELNKTQSNGGYDGITKEGKYVEVKIRSKTTGGIVLNNATLSLLQKNPMYLILFIYDAKSASLEEPRSYNLTKAIVKKLKNNMITFKELERNLDDNALSYKKTDFQKVNQLLKGT